MRPQGATGRVAKLDGDRVEVAFLDGKRATYLRAEVTPRKLGSPATRSGARRRGTQLRAVHRDRHGRRLARVGRRGRGLRRGSPRRVRAAAAVDDRARRSAARSRVGSTARRRYWEIGKAIRQALRADPNTLEMLFAEPRGRRSDRRAAGRDARRRSCRRRSTAASAATRCRSSIGSSTTSGSPSIARR